MIKQLSVGTIITDNKNILLGHTTWGQKYDLPKGRHEKGETYLQTTQREMKEEFGLYEAKHRFEILGFFEYLRDKDLYLFKLEFGNLYKDINLSMLKCNSFFEKNGEQIPEMDGYKIVSLNEIDKYCYKSMVKVLNKIFNL